MNIKNDKRYYSALSKSHYYRVYGMPVVSDLAMEELAEEAIGDSSLRADPSLVSIGFGHVPEQLFETDIDDWTLQVRGKLCLIRPAGLGRISVEDGAKITIKPKQSEVIDDLKVFLIGSALAAAAHQRGLFPLHVSAVLSPQGAVAFTGDSGAGKSTLAAHLHEQTRWPLISDDVAALTHSDGGYMLESGVRTVKLWEDALHSMNRTSHGLKKDLSREKKYHAVDSERFTLGKHAVSHLVQLRWGEDLKVEPVTGRRALQVILSSVYRPDIARMCGNTDKLSMEALALAGNIRVLRLTRPKDLLQHTRVVDLVRMLVS